MAIIMAAIPIPIEPPTPALPPPPPRPWPRSRGGAPPAPPGRRRPPLHRRPRPARRGDLRDRRVARRALARTDLVANDRARRLRPAGPPHRADRADPHPHPAPGP